MGWSLGYDDHWQRDIGYGVPAYCDFPKCNEEIDRGLSYVCCGEQPYGEPGGCGLYFCYKHHAYSRGEHYGMCSRCFNYRKPFTPKPDHPEWIQFKATDESWAQWRAEHPEFVNQIA